jgi:very-short-patch-repair endonuclease
MGRGTAAEGSGGGANVRATGRSMASARRLRRELSLPEMLLWRLLRLKRRELRFRRQHPIGPYIADFYCPAAKTVIEVDGAMHDWRQDADVGRDAYMESLGLRVIRVAAADVLADPDAVADGIYRLCEAAAGPSTTQPVG